MKKNVAELIERLGRLAYDKRAVWVILAVSILTRLIGVYLGGDRADDPDRWHEEMARNFLAGRGLLLETEFGPTVSFIQPGLAFLHILVIPFFGSAFIAAERVLIVLLSSLAIVSFFFICRRLFSPAVAAIGTAALIFYPPQWFWMTRVNPHAFATAFLLFSIHSLFAAWERKSAGRILFAGALLGLTTHMRPEYGLAAVCFSFATWLAFRHARRSVFFGCLLFLGWVAVMAPWVVRNYRIHRHIIVSTTDYGFILWLVFNPNYAGNGDVVPYDPDFKRELIEARTEMERNDLFLRSALTFMRENPLTSLGRVAGNFLLYWRPWLSPKAASLPENIVYIVSWVPLFVLFLVGLFRAPWRDPRWTAIGIFLAYKVLAQMPFYIIVRFREATMPILLLVALCAVERYLNPKGTPASPRPA